MVVLSATVVAIGPGLATAAHGDLPSLLPSAGTVRFEPLAPGGAGLTVAGTGTYRGTIEVRRHGAKLAVVNELAFEDYVRGIDEVPPSWPAAALQAQAIAARTYAAHKAAATEATPWREVGADICATPRCQVYRGLDTERKAQGHGWLPAVEATAGRVLLSGNRPIMASYSATANGPQAMSQNGALVMAQEGRSASDILAAYYGVRPTHAPDRLPATIRVALSTASSTVRVSGPGPFRVVNGDGRPLAVSSSGEWKVAPAGEGLDVDPPQGQASERQPSEELVATVMPAAAIGQPARVVTAAAPRPLRALWAAAALMLALAAAGGAITLQRRPRA